MRHLPRRLCLPRTACTEVVVPAALADVWAVVVDPTRVGEWSHEALGAEWVEGDGSAVGDVFRGTNKLGGLRWSRRCTVTAREEQSRFSYRTDGGLAGDQTEWTFELAAVEGGTRIRESYQILAMPSALEFFVVRLMPSHLDRTEALAGDLERIGVLAAR